MSKIIMQVIGDDGDVQAEGEWSIGHVGFEDRLLDTFTDVIRPVINGLHTDLADQIHEELGIDHSHEEIG